jgi:hypothetical protein
MPIGESTLSQNRQAIKELRGFAPIGIMEWWNIGLRGMKQTIYK